MSKIVNLIGYDITTIDDNGNVKATYVSEGAARAEQTVKAIGEIDNVPVYSTQFSKPTNLPSPAETEYWCPDHNCGTPNPVDCASCGMLGEKPSVYYIVSWPIAEAARATGRTTRDLLIVTEIFRKNGKDFCCKRFWQI